VNWFWPCFYRTRETAELKNPKVRRVENPLHSSSSSKVVASEKKDKRKGCGGKEASAGSELTTRELRKRKPDPEVAFSGHSGKEARPLNSSSESEDESGKTDRAKKPLPSIVPAGEEGGNLSSGTSTKTNSKSAKSCAGLPANSSASATGSSSSSSRHLSRSASHSSTSSNSHVPKVTKNKSKASGTATATTSEEETKPDTK
jgi:hypothetical protein